MLKDSVNQAGLIGKLDVQTPILKGELVLETDASGKSLTSNSLATLKNWAEAAIMANLEGSCFSGGYSVSGLTDLNNLHTDRMTLANRTAGTVASNTGSDEASVKLQYLKDAVIDYCDWLVNKSANNEYANAVNKVFGSNYANTISSETNYSNLETKFNTLKTELGKVINKDDIKVDWKDITINVDSGESFNESIVSNVKAGDKAINSGMSYSATCSQSGVTASVSANGELSFTAPTVDEDTEFTITVQPMYNGQPVGEAKEIKVKVAKALTVDDLIKNAKLGSNEKPDNYVTNIDDYNFSSLYNNDTSILLHTANVADKKNDLDDNKPTVRTKLLNALNNIVSSLEDVGLNRDLLDKAKMTVLNKYMTGLTDIDVEIDEYYCKDDKSQTAADKAAYNHCQANRSQISYARNEDGWGHDNVSFMVNFKDLVDDIIAEYKSLNGGKL